VVGDTAGGGDVPENRAQRGEIGEDRFNGNRVAGDGSAGDRGRGVLVVCGADRGEDRVQAELGGAGERDFAVVRERHGADGAGKCAAEQSVGEIGFSSRAADVHFGDRICVCTDAFSRQSGDGDKTDRVGGVRVAVDLGVVYVGIESERFRPGDQLTREGKLDSGSNYQEFGGDAGPSGGPDRGGGWRNFL